MMIAYNIKYICHLESFRTIKASRVFICFRQGSCKCVFYHILSLCDYVSLLCLVSEILLCKFTILMIYLITVSCVIYHISVHFPGIVVMCSVFVGDS